MKKLNLVLTIAALMTMATCVMGQSAQRATIPPVKRPPTDPCGPWFVGTVFVPCNTTVGALIWNPKARKYEVSFNEGQLKQAYDYVLGQATATTTDAEKKTRIKGFGEWSDEVRRKFQEFITSIPIPPPLDNPGSSMARPPIKIDLKLDYKGGEWGGSVGVSITI